MAAETSPLEEEELEEAETQRQAYFNEIVEDNDGSDEEGQSEASSDEDELIMNDSDLDVIFV